MIFEQFCKYHATNEQISSIDVKDVDRNVQERAHALCQIMKPKMEILDKVNIPFIENEFNKTPNELYKVLNPTCHGEIPDGLMNVLGQELYQKHFNDMSVSEQAIIKVLAVYLMIQI